MRFQLNMLPNVFQLFAYRGVRVGIEAFIDHHLTGDDAQVRCQHFGSDFINRWATSIVSCMTRRAPSMSEKSVQRHCRRDDSRSVARPNDTPNTAA